ncbi:cutinase family protein [uncultured Corynebacterium sp.]|uniref:cutinase family protein n=1 Tax=uncultured Corynebacterium sp. TaxID=159447 RepID=UPI0025DFCCB9|nr:cutinase family protein [uncultured Corynebacterium sp.]
MNAVGRVRRSIITVVAGACVLSGLVASPGIAVAQPTPRDGAAAGSWSGSGPIAGPISGSGSSSVPGGDAGSAAFDPPSIPYAPPAIDDAGGVRSPILPAAIWNRAEASIGRLSGAAMGMASLDDRECTAITVIHVPGSSETNEQRDPDVPHGRIVAGLGHDLAAVFGDDVRNLYLPYPADAFLTTNYRASADRGIELLEGLVAAVADACPDTRFALTGYSQGADIVDGWGAAALDGASAVDPDAVAAIALFGNPRRGDDVAVSHGTAPAGGAGILELRPSTWGRLADRVFDSCHDGDIWCHATPAMRRLAPDVMNASLHPADAAATRDALHRLVGQEALADPEVRGAVNDLLAFLLDGSADHLRYEEEIDGAPSSRAVARDFLVDHLSR